MDYLRRAQTKFTVFFTVRSICLVNLLLNHIVSCCSSVSRETKMTENDCLDMCGVYVSGRGAGAEQEADDHRLPAEEV